MRPLQKEELVAGRKYLCAVRGGDDYVPREWDGRAFKEDARYLESKFELYPAVYPLPADVRRPTRIDAINFVNFYRMEADHEKRAQIFNDFAEKFCEKED